MDISWGNEGLNFSKKNIQLALSWSWNDISGYMVNKLVRPAPETFLLQKQTVSFSPNNSSKL